MLLHLNGPSGVGKSTLARAHAARHPGTLVCDIIMEPAETALLRAASARGLPVHGGRAMLDHQLPAYLAFFGFDELARRVRIEGDAITLAPASGAAP